MTESLLKFFKRNKAIIIASICLLLSFFSVADDLVHWAGHNYIHREANKFLKSSEIAASETFLALSAARSGLAVVESSEGGITFVIEAKVQLGKIFESLKYLINRSWEASLIALSTLFASQIILDLADATDNALFIGLSALALIHYVCKRLGLRLVKTTGYWFRSLATVIFVFIFALPLSIYLTSLISDSLTRQYANEAQNTFYAHNELFEHGKNDDDSLKENSQSTIKKYKKNKKAIHEHVDTLHTQVYRHIAILLLEVVLLPLFILGMFYIVIRRILKRPFGVATAEESLKELVQQAEKSLEVK